VGCRVRELVLLVVAPGKRDEDPEIVFPGRHFNACACELGGELVKASGCETFFRTVDEEG